MSVRWVVRVSFVFGLTAVALAATALAQQPSAGLPDRVFYREDDGKLVSKESETKESVSGVGLVAAGKVGKMITPTNVVRIDYNSGSLAGIPLAELLAARNLEDGKDAAKAAAAFAELSKKAGTNAPEKTRRYLTFREAYWLAKATDAKPFDDFKTEANRTVDKLVAVARLSKKSWEVWPTSKLAARYYGELDDFAKAASTFNELAAIPDLPKELRFEARLGEALALLRAKQSLSAEGALDALEKDKEFPATGALRDRLLVLKAVAKAPPGPGGDAPIAKPAEPIAKIEEAIAAAKDPVAKGLGYAGLGDIYLGHGLTRDAMWSYLWVDTVYNQDRDDRIIAIRKLVGVFEKLGNTDRAAEFKDKLIGIR